MKVKIEHYEETGFLPMKRAVSVEPTSKMAPFGTTAAAGNKNRFQTLLQQAQHRRRLRNRSVVAISKLPRARTPSRSPSISSTTSGDTNTTSGLRLDGPRPRLPPSRLSHTIVIDDDSDNDNDEDEDDTMPQDIASKSSTQEQTSSSKTSASPLIRDAREQVQNL